MPENEIPRDSFPESPSSGSFPGDIAALFLELPGDDAYAALAERIGRLAQGFHGVFACPESWGSYAVFREGVKGKRVLDMKEWKALPGESGWDTGVATVKVLCAEGETVCAVPLLESGAVIGFSGWVCGPEASLPVQAVDFLKSQAMTLGKFTAQRVAGTRKETFRRMTEDAYAKSERRFRDLIEDSRDMIYIADAQGIVTLTNRAAEEMLGMPANEIIGKPFAALCPFRHDFDYLNEKIAKDGFVRDFEITLMNKAGDTVFVTISANVVRDAGGGVAEIHGIVRDITERLKSQRELWKANMDLAEVNEELKKTQLAMIQQEKLASIGQLAAGIAHEINNPLGFLMADFGVLKKASAALIQAVALAKLGDVEGIKALTVKSGLDFLAEDLPSMFEEMDDGFKRISEIVRNLRSFARTGENEGKMDYNVNDGLERSIAIARNEIKYVADVEKHYGTIPQVSVNSGEINQVFLNILVNAAQAIGASGKKERGKIVVTTGTRDGFAWVEIADNGPGVPPEAAKRLFEPFFTTKEPGKGTGLGLSISYDIITRKHGGTIAFNPGKDGGTVFRIELPLKEAD